MRLKHYLSMNIIIFAGWQHKPKPVRKYTLMDSLILEGTAEYTVEKILGRKYCAGWVRLYNEEELKKCWHSLIKE